MTSTTNKAGSEPCLITSYTTQRNNSPVILELWGSQDAITNGVVKDLTGNKISTIPETSILGGEDRSIIGSALLTYLKTVELSAVLCVQGKEEEVWLVPHANMGSGSPENISTDEREAETIPKNLLGSDFVELIRENCHNKEDLDGFGNQLIINGVQSYQNSRFAEAAVWFVRALFIYILLDNKKNIVDCYEILGNTYDSLKEYRKAIQYHEKHLQAAIEIEDKAGEGKAYGSLGVAYYNLCNYKKAIQYHEKHLRIAIKIEDKAGEGKAHGSLGIAYQVLGDYHKAIYYQEKALQIAIGMKDWTNEGAAYANLGIAHHNLGYYQKSTQCHEKHLRIAIKIEDKAGEGKAYGNLGIAYQSLGDFRKAIQCQEKYLQIASEFNDRIGRGKAYANLGNGYYYLCDYQKAIQYHEKHLQIAIEMENRASEGAAHANLGIAYHTLGDHQKAIQYQEKYLQITRKLKDRKGLGHAYENLGISYQSLGEYQKAIEYHEKGLQIAKAREDHGGERRAYSGLGNVYRGLKNHQKAAEYHEKSIRIAMAGEDRVSEAKANHNLGVSLLELQDYSKSEKVFIQSISIFSEIQAKLEHDEWKISIFEEQSKPYCMLQYNYFTTGKAQEALETCEKGRARALFDLYCDRLKFSKKMCEERGKITVEKMQAIAKREKTSFIYFSRSLENEVHVWVVKENEMHGKKIELPEDFKTKVLPSSGGEASRQSLVDDYLSDSRGLSFKLKSSFKKEKEPGESTQLSEGLEKCYQSLITPIEEWLDGERLTIITDATMRDVPFAALYKNGPNGREYLIDKYTISITPSVRIFDLLHELKPLSDGSALIVADPAIKENRLPGAKSEGKALAQRIPNSKNLFEEKATIEAVKQAASNTSILHFACHGSADARISRDSVFEGGLCLTNGNGEKEMLFADEIQQLDLKANLVFLSACQTGKGAERREGVIGLSRAFLGAGVPSVIATHWNIDDHITQEIVSDFYTNLLDKGMKKAEALRYAMLKQRLAHSEKPHLWGAFFLIGK